MSVNYAASVDLEAYKRGEAEGLAAGANFANYRETMPRRNPRYADAPWWDAFEDGWQSGFDHYQGKNHAKYGGEICRWSAYGTCLVCHVGDTTCDACGGRGYHRDGCRESD